jgi:hypothetical protein
MTDNDRCDQLRKLYGRIEEELRVLKASEREEEREGIESPAEISNIIKSLQETLASISLELAKCPPEA